MKLSIVYLDCCLPDYFQGFGGHVYAVPMHDGATNAEVLKELQQAITGEEVFLSDGTSADAEHYQQLHESANDLFSTATPSNEFSRHAGDESYAYFGVKESDDSDE